MDETERTGLLTPETENLTPTNDRTVTWQASEFVHHDKTSGWYFTLGGSAVLVGAIIYMLTKDVVSVLVILVSAGLLGAYASRQPRQLQYQIDSNGIQIGERHHGYNEFKSFSVIQDGAFASIVFMPLKRFALLTTIYFAPEEQEAVVALLSDYLPFENHKLDAIDRFLRRIRF